MRYVLHFSGFNTPTFLWALLHLLNEKGFQVIRLYCDAHDIFAKITIEVEGSFYPQIEISGFLPLGSKSYLDQISQVLKSSEQELKILFVDDDKKDFEKTRQKFQDRQELVHISDTEEFRKKLNDPEPKIVLLDILWGEGREDRALEYLRIKNSNPEWSYIPLFMMSINPWYHYVGGNGPISVLNYWQNGAWGFLQKRPDLWDRPQTFIEILKTMMGEEVEEAVITLKNLKDYNLTKILIDILQVFTERHIWIQKIFPLRKTSKDKEKQIVFYVVKHYHDGPSLRLIEELNNILQEYSSGNYFFTEENYWKNKEMYRFYGAEIFSRMIYI